MDISQLFVTIAIILLPGVVATVICDKILVHAEKWDSFKYGLYAYIFGVCSYVALQLLFYVFGALHYVFWGNFQCKYLSIWGYIADQGGGEKGHQGAPLNLLEIASAVILAFPLAFMAAWTVNAKIFTRVAQRLKVSTKFGDENLYSFFLNSPAVSWVYVRDIENDLCYRAQVAAFAESDGIQELALSNVTVYTNSNGNRLYDVGSVYLSKERGKLAIETA